MKTRKPPTRKGRRKTPKNKGRTEYNIPLTDIAQAMIWTLTEEGLSQRGVAKELRITVSTVWRELASDPVRHEALRTRQREARSQGWRQLETLSLDEAIGWVQSLRRVRLSRSQGISERQERRIMLIPRAIQATRHTAETSTKMVQLLTGGATDRVDQTRGEVDETNAEQLVQMAIEANLVDRLPPSLQEYAKRKGAAAK